MIHYIRFRNFYSFGIDAEERWAEIDFRVAEDAPENRFTFCTPSGVRLNRVLAAIGPNASGKTHLIRVGAFLHFFMFHSHSDIDPEENIPLKSHIFEESDTVQFEIKFELLDGSQFLYSLDATPERVVRERLEDISASNTIFDRQWNQKEKKYNFDSSARLGFSPTENLPLRVNVSALSTARQNAGSLSTIIEKAFFLGIVNVFWEGKMPTGSLYFERTPVLLKRFPDLLAAFNRMLGNLDLGVTHFEIIEEEFRTEDGKKVKRPFPIGFHQVHGETKAVDFFDESNGTKMLFFVFPRILRGLSQGGISFWDEIESDLHPDMIQAIVRLFLQPETNPHNAQIIFSSHNHEILKLLNPDQVLLVEKEADVFSVVRRLDTVEGVGMDDNLYGRYMAKAYGAKPNIQLDQAVVQFLAEVRDGFGVDGV